MARLRKGVTSAVATPVKIGVFIIISFPAECSATDMTEFDGEFSSFILYAGVWWDAIAKTKKRFSSETEKYRSYRKTHQIFTLPNPIALRNNDSRTNLICQTKQCAPVYARFRQTPLFALRRLSGTLTETNTDDASHLYHDSIS